MANVTDPLVGAVHGTDPQNLMEYITRQKIYGCRYWKEECFGLTAADVVEKATRLTCYGASFGGNSQPTKFLCLVLKLLQIQPPQELIDSYLEAEDFKYLRALGAFYKRLTGRPADVYLALEPLYTEYCKLRYRDISEWKVYTMDQFIHQLLHDARVCGISLPRLPSRETLQEEGFLENPYQSPILTIIGTQTLEEYLLTKVVHGSQSAKLLWNARRITRHSSEGGNLNRLDTNSSHGVVERRFHEGAILNDQTASLQRDPNAYSRRINDPVSPKRARLDRNNDERKYGGLFKSSKCQAQKRVEDKAPPVQGTFDENSEKFWNAQRAKLGMKPLRKN